MMDNDARTARAYSFAAFWVQAALFVVGAFLLSVALVYWIFGVDIGLFGLFGMSDMVNNWTWSLTLGQTLYLVAAIALTASAVWLVADYYKIYRKLSEGKVSQAERSALWFGTVQTIVGGTVAGLLLLYAYVKIRKSELKTRRAQPSF